MDDYREYLIGLGLKPKTVRTYELTLLRVLEWVRQNDLDLKQLKPSQMAELADIWPFTHSSRRQLRSTVAHYWEMSGVSGPAKAIRVPPPPQPRWRGIEDDQTMALIRLARSEWPIGAVIYLGLYLGLRREEIATLRWANFDDDLTWVRVLGKRDRTRDLPVHPRVQAILAPQRWPGEYVFPGRLGGHVSVTTINNWIADISRRAGLDHLGPHQLRHTFGGKVYEETGDVYLVRDLLGHVEVKTTLTYTRVQKERKIRGVRSLNWEDSEPPLAA